MFFERRGDAPSAVCGADVAFVWRTPSRDSASLVARHVYNTTLFTCPRSLLGTHSMHFRHAVILSMSSGLDDLCTSLFSTCHPYRGPMMTHAHRQNLIKGDLSIALVTPFGLLLPPKPPVAPPQHPWENPHSAILPALVGSPRTNVAGNVQHGCTPALMRKL
jgi:hypothetical protein